MRWRGLAMSSSRWTSHDGSIVLLLGDCLGVMPTLDAEVAAVITDPPYGLEFMGKDWDRGVPGEAFWCAAMGTAKPGAHLLAFGGTRTFHRLACAVEDAGWEIRDSLFWLYGSGFPKSLNLDGEWKGWGTALKPACEPITMARKPLVGTVAANVLEYGTGAINIDGCRVATDGETFKAPRSNPENRAGIVGSAMQATGSADRNHAAQAASIERTATLGRWPANVILDDEAAAMLDAQTGQLTSGVMAAGTRRAAQDGPGSVCYGTYGGNATASDTYGDTGGASRFFYCAKPSRAERDAGTHAIDPRQRDESRKAGDPGGDNPRNRGVRKRGNFHPTVKPVELMRWLIRLVTPLGGLVLDPFVGSGTTGVAAWREGRRFIGIEREPEYFEIARRRLDDATRQGRLL